MERWTVEEKLGGWVAGDGLGLARLILASTQPAAWVPT